MSKNLYDLFSEYKGELPEIKEEKCDSERIKQLVRQQTSEKKNIKVRRNPKMFIISIAAALTAVTSITAAAYSDNFGGFKKILRHTEASPAVNSELPLVNGSDTDGMEDNISVDSVAFTGSDSVSVKTAGMYYDNNTFMLSVEMKVGNGITIPDNAVVLPYFTKYANGQAEELREQSGSGNAAKLVKGDDAQTYYATFYISDEDLAGSTIGVRLENIINQNVVSDCQSALVAEQNKWHEEFGTDSSIEDWKAYWKENDLDKRTLDFMDSYYRDCDKIVEGSWTAEVEVPADIADTNTFENNGFRVKTDTLSITVDAERDIPEGAAYEPVITLKNGDVIFTTGTKETEWLRENGVFTSEDKHENFASVYSNVFSYSKPHDVDDIAEVAVYIFNYEGAELTVEKNLVYTAD